MHRREEQREKKEVPILGSHSFSLSRPKAKTSSDDLGGEIG